MKRKTGDGREQSVGSGQGAGQEYSARVNIKRGNTNIASCRIGERTWRASSTCSEIAAALRLAEKAGLELHADSAAIDGLRVVSMFAAIATLRLTFQEGGAA